MVKGCLRGQLRVLQEVLVGHTEETNWLCFEISQGGAGREGSAVSGCRG
jgi:hypothetical protein